jgi:hypothetical protein
MKRRPETLADQNDRPGRANEGGAPAAAPTPEAEARARRLEEIRLSIVEEWRWRESSKD